MHISTETYKHSFQSAPTPRTYKIIYKPNITSRTPLSTILTGMHIKPRLNHTPSRNKYQYPNSSSTGNTRDSNNLKYLLQTAPHARTVTTPKHPTTYFNAHHRPSSQKKTNRINSFVSQLKTINTATPIITFIQEHYIRWLHNYTQQQAHPPTATPDTTLAINQQYQIGIDQLARGRISTHWTHIQDTHGPHLQGYNKEQWASRFISALWELSFDLWKIRNNRLHNSIDQEATKVRWVNEQIASYYSVHNTSPFHSINSKIANSNKKSNGYKQLI